MKKSLLIIALLFASFAAFTDDGGSYKPEDWTYGNIYVKEPNDKIALERELLVVEHTAIGEYDRKSDTFHKTSGREVTARFDFLNTTRERVTVPCAFPVVVKTQVSVKKDGTVSAEVPVGNGYMANETVIAIAFGKSGIEGTAKEALLSLDKKLRTISAKDYLAELSRTERSDSVMRPCSIEQDGNNVPILTVGIETTVEKDEEGTMTPLSAKCGFCRSPPPQKESLLLTVITMAFTPPQSQTLCKLMLHTMFRGRQQYSRTKRDSGENKMSEVEAW